MRKWLILSMVVLIMMMLSACSNHSVEQNKDRMILTIKNNADFDFYAIEIGTAETYGGISNADGSKIKKEDTLSKEYADQEDFDLEGVAMFNFFLIVGEGNRIPLDKVTLELAPNREYFFEISGDSIDGARLKRVEGA
ncbi:hypothetical protein EQV77_16105 [Halobacillus fulvus]|nr:hypothetical protein EQV77_16105 [Halobacillus fulvus]